MQLADWGQEVASQGPGQASGNWSQEQTGHFPGTASRAEGGEAGPPAVLFSWEAGPLGAQGDNVFTQRVQLGPG